MKLLLEKRRLLALLLCLLFLCSCSSTPTADRVSEEEAIALREQYPYKDVTNPIASGTPAEAFFTTFESLFGNNPYRMGSDICAVVVLKIKSDWYDISKYNALFDDDELNDLVVEKNPSLATMTWNVFDAKVEKVLWTSNNEVIWRGEYPEKGDTVTLGFGQISGNWDHGEIYKVEDWYVCFLVDWRDHGYNCESLFKTGGHYAFHLTDDDVLVSATKAAGADFCTGMYLHAFEKLLNETLTHLREPDAELTPVPPDVVQE